MSARQISKLQGIIFDVDGTLADTEEAHRIAFNITFKEFGLNWHWSPEEYERLLSISGGKERIESFGKRLRKNHPDNASFLNYIAQIHERKSLNYRSMISRNEVNLRLGVKRLILEASTSEVDLNIATSSSHANVDTLLSVNLGANWQEYFSIIETSNTTKKKKPDPAVYKNVLKKTGLNPENVIAIEDTTNGLKAASGAGIKAVITVHRLTANHSFDGASLVLDSMGEPDQSFKVLSGKAFNSSYLDITLLEKLLET